MTRARELGLPLSGRTGPGNAITDVPGVEVGYTTLIEGTPSGPASPRSCRAAARISPCRARRAGRPSTATAR